MFNGIQRISFLEMASLSDNVLKIDLAPPDRCHAERSEASLFGEFGVGSQTISENDVRDSSLAALHQ